MSLGSCSLSTAQPSTLIVSDESTPPIKTLPVEVMMMIFSYLNLTDLAACRAVDREWRSICGDKILTKRSVFNEIAIGSRIWREHLGCQVDTNEEYENLPLDIYSILMRPCPFIPNKQIIETHVLVWTPKICQGKELTLVRFNQRLQAVNPELKVRFYEHQPWAAGGYRDLAVTHSHWILMAKRSPEKWGKLSFTKQKALLAGVAERERLGYGAPSVVDVTLAVMLYFCVGGERILWDSFTRCSQLPLLGETIVGGFWSQSLYVQAMNGDGSKIGVLPTIDISATPNVFQNPI